MIKYVAFLRGINVGGRKLIKMDALRSVFESIGFKNVRTYIQSGNVVFETARKDPVSLKSKVEKQLLQSFGHEVDVILMAYQDLAGIVKRDPFKQIKQDDVVLFVTLLSTAPSASLKLPLPSTTENLDVIALHDRAAFIVARRKKTGLFAFPNNFIEKQFGVVGTTRNWSSLRKIVDFAGKD